MKARGLAGRTTTARAALTRLDLLTVPTVVVLGGGVLTSRDEILLAEIDARLAEVAPLAKTVVTEVSPVVGAALLGLDRLGASAEAKQALRAGRRLDGKTMAPPMSGFVPHFSGMTDEDLDAVVAYLRSIPAKKHKIHERELTPAAKKLVGQNN